MSRLCRLFSVSCALCLIFVLSACETVSQRPWWEVPGTEPPTTTAGGPGGVYDPTSVPRPGDGIPPWDPSMGTVQQPDAQVKAEEWMTRYDPRGGIRAARVGLLVPLSGSAGEVGKEIMNAAQLALFDFAGPRFELLPYDTKGTSAGAVEAVRFAISDGASIIVGPLLSSSAQSIAPYLQAANLSALALTNDSLAASSNVFVLGIRPEEEVNRVIAFARAQGSERFALLAPADEYGIRVRSAFENAVTANGGQLSRIIQFLGSDDLQSLIKDLANYDERRKALLEQRAQLESKNDALSRQALERLENLQTLGDVDFDTLLIAAGGNSLQSIAAHLPYYDVDPKKVRMLGTSLWEARWVGAEPALLGGIFAAPSQQNRADFVRQYKETYGQEPHRLATLAYDAVALTAVLASEDGQADYSRQTLTNPSGFLGRAGIFRLDPSGLTERGLAVMQVQRRGFREVSPAPTTFIPATN